MDALDKYIALVGDFPELFTNTGEEGEIRIITDVERIRVEQKRIREQLISQGKPESWIDIGVLSEDQWFWVIRDLVEFPGGKVGGYIRWINRKSQTEKGYNCVMMCNRANHVLMIRKYRHEERGWVWEFPRGFGEPGLTAEENARQELIEEIGMDHVSLELLTEVKEGKGGTAVFFVEIAKDQEIKLDVGEGIQDYRWISFEELSEFVREGKLVDWFSLWAYALAQEKSCLQSGGNNGLR